MRVVKTHDMRVEPVDRQRELYALAAADPVALLGAVRSGQPSSWSSSFEQPFGVVGDLQEPLREIAAFDRVTAAPAPPSIDLFVGEHGLIVRTPIDRRLTLVRKPVFVQPQEEPLIPAVVVGQAQSRFRATNRSSCPSAESGGACSRCSRCPRRGIDAALDRGVFGR